MFHLLRLWCLFGFVNFTLRTFNSDYQFSLTFGSLLKKKRGRRGRVVYSCYIALSSHVLVGKA